MQKTIKSLEEMDSFSKEVLENLNKKESAVVLALGGNLGSGKTTFTQFLSKNLGVKEDTTSPTFVILKKYKTDNSIFENLIHIDAYRLESAKELEVLDFKDFLAQPKNLIAIEWPENVSEIIPENAYNINFKFIDDKTREVEWDF